MPKVDGIKQVEKQIIILVIKMERRSSTGSVNFKTKVMEGTSHTII